MEQWEKSLASAITTYAELADLFSLEGNSLEKVIDRYPMRITPYYMSLIQSVGDPVWRQCIPDPAELADNQIADPLSEESLSPVPGLIHRYPDRVVWLVSNECAVYCRFCLRKRQVGCGSDNTLCNREAVLDYISSRYEIRDVILSGGDPLLLSDCEISELLTSLRKIRHVEIIRIGTRAPVTLPERITPALCRILKRFHPLYINTHFNYSCEITPKSAKACAMLADAGIQMGNQAVLLKDVNDDPATMKRLMQGLLVIRVRPYYIHQMDQVQGTAHFSTSVRQGIAVMEALRGHTSGLATPYYVIDLPGGKGKVPILPDVTKWKKKRLLLRNYLGEMVEYKS